MSITDPHARGNYILSVKHSLIGSRVTNTEDQDLGKIEDIVIDTRTDEVAYAILSLGGFLGIGDKRFAIPWEAIEYRADGRYALLHLDGERLRNSPGFEKDDWPDMTDTQWAERIHSHYGTTRSSSRKRAASNTRA